MSMRTIDPSGRPPTIDVVQRTARAKRSRSITIAAVSVVSVAAIASGIALVLWGGGEVEEKYAPSTAHALGRSDAAVTVAVFADFQCPACRVFATTQEQELIDDLVASGEVRLVFRHLAFIGEESVQAAEASECAGDQGKFWEYHDKLYANWDGENKGAFADTNLVRFASELNLNTTSFSSCLNTGKYAGLIEQEKTAASRLTVRATPTFFINGEKFQGIPTDYATLKQFITQAKDVAASS